MSSVMHSLASGLMSPSIARTPPTLPRRRPDQLVVQARSPWAHGATKDDDRMIAALETTMSGLTFRTDDTGLVRIEEASLVHEQRSLLEFTPPPTPTGRDGVGVANLIPMELVCLVLEFIHPHRQDVFAATSKVSRQWYLASQRFLYRYPKINGKNYPAFVNTISPTSTNLTASPLGSLVKRLDLSRIVHEGKPSSNARLLRRTQVSLEEFIAPQVSFGYNCIVALGHCMRLRVLDLSLICQSINLDDLFRHISDLPNLEVIKFPRSSLQGPTGPPFKWPKRLKSFSLGGSVLSYILKETNLPSSLHEVHISHSPFARAQSVLRLLSSLSHQLTSLSISYPMPCLGFDALDQVLLKCPQLKYLLVAVDYITSRFFDEVNSPNTHPLRQLDLESSGNPGIEHKIRPDEIFIAVAEGQLTSLRVVRFSKRLRWVEREPEDVEDLAGLLEEKSREAHDPPGTRVGVWVFDPEEATTASVPTFSPPLPHHVSMSERYINPVSGDSKPAPSLR